MEKYFIEVNPNKPTSDIFEVRNEGQGYPEVSTSSLEQALIYICGKHRCRVVLSVIVP